MIVRTAPSRPEGSQSIGRAVELLTHVAGQAEQGARLSQLVQLSRLNIATARRILQALVSEGLLAFDPKTKIYSVGPAIVSLAVQGHVLFSQRDSFMPVLDAIARRTQDTVLLSVRSGAEAVCLARREGGYPIRVMSLQEGSRRPLGAGSGSLAILAFLPAEEASDIVRHCAPQYDPFGLSATLVSKGVAEARRSGFSFNPGLIIADVYGVGVPVMRAGRVLGAISVASIASRMGPTRRQEIVGVIREELASLGGYDVPEAPVQAPPRPRNKVA